MGDDHIRNDHPSEGCPGENLSPAVLIRAYVDGELSDAQLSEFEALRSTMPDLDARVQAERDLKSACGRVMDIGRCPDALREKILAMTGSGAAPSMRIEDHAPVEAAPVGDGVSEMSVATRQVSFWRRSPGLAAAAAVLLAFGGFLVWQSSQIPVSSPNPAGMSVSEVQYRDRVADFVTGEHRRCCASERAAQAKMSMLDAEEAGAYFAERMGTASLDLTPTMVAASEQAGYEPTGPVVFEGGGDCHVPGTDFSGHLRYQATNEDGQLIHLSLFIAPETTRLPLEEGQTYVVGSKACEDAGVNLFAWRADGVLYLLVSEATGAACPTVREALHAPMNQLGAI